MLRFALLSLLLLAAPAAAADTLTVKTGESWIFTLFRGQPTKARKASPTARPGRGQLLVTVKSMFGTTMTISGNNPIAYTFEAELLGAGKAVPVRSCGLPADGKISFEHWPDKAEAVRIGKFKPAPKNGRC